MELRDYLRVLRRRKRVLLLVIAVFFAGAVVASIVTTPVYASEAEVLLQRRNTDSPFDTSANQYVDPTRNIQTEIRVVESHPIRLAVRQKLGYDAKISARSAGQANVMLLHAESTSAKKAADIANAYAAAYVDERKQEAVGDIQASIKEIQAKITDLQHQIDAASGASQQSLITQSDAFKDKLNELQVSAALQTGGVQTVSPALESNTPVRPRPARNAVLGLGVGLFIGIGAVFLVDYLDDTVKTKEDLERAEPELPVVAVIPAVGGWKPRDEPRLVSLTDPSSAASEAYRALRTSIQFPMFDSPVRSIQVTSPNAQEGKTTTLANLGVALAGAGHRVVIVCCDLRRPRVHEFFGLDNSFGFTSVLLGEGPVSAALQRVPGVERLYLLSSGPLPPNPSELLQSRRAAEILRSVESEGSFLLLDSPPVLPVTDALVLSKRVHGTLLVCAAGRTGRRELSRATELLRQMRAPLIGAVLNGVSDETVYGYQYGYYRSEYHGNGNTNGNGTSPGRPARPARPVRTDRPPASERSRWTGPTDRG